MRTDDGTGASRADRRLRCCLTATRFPANDGAPDVDPAHRNARMMRTLRSLAQVAAAALLLVACEDVEIKQPASPDDPSQGDQIPAVQEDEGTIVSLRIGGEANEAASTFYVGHPIQVTISVTPTRAAHDHPVYVGLVEKLAPGAEHSEAQTCLLGGFDAFYQQDANDPTKPTRFTEEFRIPPDCLKDGDAQRVFNLWVAMNPLLETPDGGDPAYGGHVSSKDYNTQFFNDASLDLDGQDRNKLCKTEDGQEGCVLDVTVVGSPGHNLEYRSLQPESVVAVLPADCSVDHANPPLAINGIVYIFGSRAQDGQTAGQDPVNALEKAGGPGAKATISHALCPAGEKAANAAPEDPAPCVNGTSYVPLKFLGDHENETDFVETFEVTELVAGEPHEFHHQVYLPPGSEACLRATGDPTAAQDWSAFGSYNLKSCITTASFTEARENGHELDDNCKIVPIKLVITASAPPAAANSYSLAKSWDSNVGNSVVGMKTSFGTNNQLTLSGATFNASAKSSLTGWVSTDIFAASATAAAYVALVGSGVSLSLDVFGQRVWGYDKQIQSFAMTWDQSFSKQYCARYNYGVAGIGLNAQFCATGSAGLKSSVNLYARDGAGAAPFDSATKVGQANGTATPYGSVQLSASAWADAYLARGGINAAMTLLSLSAPINATLQWGLTGLGPTRLLIKGSATMDTQLIMLLGYIHGWAEVRRPDWCSCGSWCPGYPCTSWSSVWDENLAYWWGFWFYQRLFSASNQLTIQ